MQHPGQSQTLLKAFISTFTSDNFIVDLARITLFPAEFGAFTSDRSNSTIDYIKLFLKGLNDMSRKLQLPTSKTIQSQIQAINTLLTIRESSTTILTYDNVSQHLPVKDLIISKLIQKATENRISDNDDFRKNVDNIINIIHAYYEVLSVSGTITILDNLQESIIDKHLSPFESLKNYKDTIIAAYNDLSKLQSLSKNETIADYFIISDDKSCNALANTLVEYVSKGYSVFKTGYEFFDKILDGIESSSVHLISAPSNHGKSMMLVNLCKKMIESNVVDFQKNDCVLYITLEEDIYQLSRRFISIFGNYKFEVIKQLFAKAFEVTRSQQIMGVTINEDNTLVDSLKKIFNNVLKSSIAKVTQGKVNLIIKHCNENTFSPGDLGRFIDRLKVEGYNTKLVLVDYLDTMTPTMSAFGNMKEYDTQGQITQEFRSLSRIHSVPIISPTQNQRTSEDITKKMDNSLVGDSYKKIRYTDYMYMQRMREDKNFLSEDVRPFVVPKKESTPGQDDNSYLTSIKDKLVDVLVPLEIKITKSKNSEKNKTRYMLFCKDNLRIYNNIHEYTKDSPIIEANTSKLQKDIALITDRAIANVVTSSDFMGDTNTSNQFAEPIVGFQDNPFDNIPSTPINPFGEFPQMH